MRPADRRPKDHPLKGKRFELLLSRPLSTAYQRQSQIELVGPYIDIFMEDVEMSKSDLALSYVSRRQGGGQMQSIEPAVFGYVDGKQCVVHVSELGKELK